MEISREQYEEAIRRRDEANALIREFYKQRVAAFERRLEENPVFTDEELVYAAFDLCPCGHGIAYPKNCGINHYWDCSAILKGIADPNVKHTDKLPFVFWSIKSENQPSAKGCTTRGVFKPKPTGDK